MAKENEEMIKRAVISGAAHALKYKEKSPNESDSEILRRIMRELREITREIDRE
ncbi:MAG TPA: hypothetical protein VMC07_03010 [Candidatus Omnitrophota bacterium]|nr:hypothetical protein [Candidatus Omnitrophota bacterium]